MKTVTHEEILTCIKKLNILSNPLDNDLQLKKALLNGFIESRKAEAQLIPAEERLEESAIEKLGQIQQFIRLKEEAHEALMSATLSKAQILILRYLIKDSIQSDDDPLPALTHLLDSTTKGKGKTG